MNARRRDKRNEGLPPYLYDDCHYWKYSHPTRDPVRWPKKVISRQQAIKLASMLNAQYAPDPEKQALAKAQRIRSPHTVESIIKGFLADYVPERQWSPDTLANAKYKLDKYIREIGGQAFRQDVITVDFLSRYFKPLTKNAYVKHRQLWTQLCDYAISVGALPVGYNPASATLRKREEKRKRMRIKNYGVYQAIYRQADPCVQIAMDFALITLQSGLEVVNFKLPRRDDEKIRVVRQKTKDYIKIDVGPSLEAVFKRSRLLQAESGIASPYLVWRRPASIRKAKGRKHFTQLTRSQLGRLFKKAVERTGLFADVARDRWPTPHEIRSFGKQCYKLQNADPKNVQNLLGHEDEKTSFIYDEDHDIAIDWKIATADLDISKLGDQ